MWVPLRTVSLWFCNLMYQQDDMLSQVIIMINIFIVYLICPLIAALFREGTTLLFCLMFDYLSFIFTRVQTGCGLWMGTRNKHNHMVSISMVCLTLTRGRFWHSTFFRIKRVRRLATGFFKKCAILEVQLLYMYLILCIKLIMVWFDVTANNPRIFILIPCLRLNDNNFCEVYDLGWWLPFTNFEMLLWVLILMGLKWFKL